MTEKPAWDAAQDTIRDQFGILSLGAQATIRSLVERGMAEAYERGLKLGQGMERLNWRDVSPVLLEVAQERGEQVFKHGWTAAHDDVHTGGDLVYAAASYALSATGHYSGDRAAAVPGFWPWTPQWWKPKAPRADLLRAAALLVAEVERLDRAAARKAAMVEVPE